MPGGSKTRRGRGPGRARGTRSRGEDGSSALVESELDRQRSPVRSCWQERALGARPTVGKKLVVSNRQRRVVWPRVPPRRQTRRQFTGRRGLGDGRTPGRDRD